MIDSAVYINHIHYVNFQPIRILSFLEIFVNVFENFTSSADAFSYSQYRCRSLSTSLWNRKFSYLTYLPDYCRYIYSCSQDYLWRAGIRRGNAQMQWWLVVGGLARFGSPFFVSWKNIVIVAQSVSSQSSHLSILVLVSLSHWTDELFPCLQGIVYLFWAASFKDLLE